MGKIKKWYRSVPIWLAIFLYAAAALALASFLSNRVTGAAYSGMTGLTVEYILSSENEAMVENGVTYSVVTKDGVTGQAIMPEGGAAVAWTATLNNMREEDAHRYRALQLLSRYAPLAIYSAALLSAALAFYFTKLKKPMALLETASAKITENELDFSLDYAGRDEMAKLCGSFEKMRSALDENNMRMLRMIDEQQQLNDAYTHDLRTPIAVLKGYTDMLVKYLPAGQLSQEEVLETAHTMSAHVARLEQFVGSMNTAQRIVDLTVQRQALPAEELVSRLRETAALLCGSKGLSCQVESCLSAGTLNVDPGAVMQVFENLLSNALRFAASRIAVRLEEREGTLAVCVADDGKGFSGKELLTAAKPYYSGKQDMDGYHFGLGLYICRTLCEKHGGGLRLANGENGGARVTAYFAMEA